MKNSSKVIALAYTTVSTLLLSSCSTETSYSAVNKPNPIAKQSVVAPEQADVSVQSDASGEFFKKGQSLDLYIVMDKSGSLWEYQGSEGSDPNCLRLNALLNLVDGLRTQLNQKELVRLNVITFGSRATNVGSISDLLSMSKSELDDRLRSAVCDKPSSSNRSTIYSNALNLISEQLKTQRELKKMDVETAIFFSDGAAKDEDANELRSAIVEFNKSFPKRAYGVLLGETADTCKIENASGEPLSTIDCITEVVGGDPTRVVQSASAQKLSETMIQLLKK
jgi:uncharacterized protein YegL